VNAIRADDVVSLSTLGAGLPEIRQSPRDAGALRMIVRRPHVGGREILDAAVLDVADGLVGDRWTARRSRSGTGPPDADRQITIMNARAIALIARTLERWPLAGDQLYIDLDLSTGHLPPGTRLALGAAILEVTAQPHTGCGKFGARFGIDAVKFVNSEVGRQLNLRGVNAKVVQSGCIRTGDLARSLPSGFR
jgi:MOSC domain-containing protein YiiM